MEEAEKKYDKPRIGKTMAFCWRCLLYRCWLSTKYNTSILISFFFAFSFRVRFDSIAVSFQLCISEAHAQ